MKVPPSCVYKNNYQKIILKLYDNKYALKYCMQI